MKARGVLRKPPEVLSHNDVDDKARKEYDELFADYLRIKELLIELGEYWNPIRNAFPGLKGCSCWRDVGLGDDSLLSARQRAAKESEVARLFGEYDLKRSAYVATYKNCFGTDYDKHRKFQALWKKVAAPCGDNVSHWRDALRTVLEEAVSCEDTDLVKLINESCPKMSFWGKVSSKLTAIP